LSPEKSDDDGFMGSRFVVEEEEEAEERAGSRLYLKEYRLL
jgi:hypothetical protein